MQIIRTQPWRIDMRNDTSMNIDIVNFEQIAENSIWSSKIKRFDIDAGLCCNSLSQTSKIGQARRSAA